MTRITFGWPETCLALLALAIALTLLGTGLLARGSVDGAFALSALALVALMTGIGGLVYWAFFDVMRRALPWEARMLYLALIFLLVPVGAILYYGLSARAAPSHPPHD